MLLGVGINPICQVFCRGSHQRCSIKKGVLENFAKLTGKHLCQRLFFNKVARLRTQAKETLAKVFSCEFAKFLRTPFLKNISGRLLLHHT